MHYLTISLNQESRQGLAGFSTSRTSQDVTGGGFDSKLSQLLGRFGFLLPTGLRPLQRGSLRHQRAQAKKEISQMAVTVFCKLIMEVTSHRHAVAYWLEVSHQVQPTLEGRD